MAAVQPVTLSSVPRFELKHILVTTDFSECSVHALRQAAAIARLHGSELLVLHVVPKEPMIENSLEPATWEWEDVIRQAKSQMATAETTDVLAGIPHQLLVEHGSLEDILLSLIEDHDISLVVVGTHGRSGFKKLLMGSVAEEIFREAECPVMTIGPSENPALLSHGRFQSIVLATDFSQGSMHAVPYAVGFARESQARLTLLHVVEESSVTALYMHATLVEDSRERLKEMLPPDVGSVPHDVEIVTGYPVEQILRVAEVKEADLIVMGVHKASRFGAHTSAHLPWTIAQAVVCHAKCPVLTVRG